MTYELEQRIDDEKCEQLIARIREAHGNGALKIRDWIAMYDLLIEACEREKAEALEDYITEQINSEGDVQ